MLVIFLRNLHERKNYVDLGRYSKCLIRPDIYHCVQFRDAVSVLLHKNDRGGEVSEAAPPSAYVIDVRRHDERALYGHIKGSHHVPGDSSSQRTKLFNLSKHCV